MANVDPEAGRSALPESSSVDPTTEISDGVLPDGRIVELIRDGSTGELKLLVSDGTSVETASSVRVEGRTFLPVRLDPAIQRAVTLPSHASDYGSTESLFQCDARSVHHARDIGGDRELRLAILYSARGFQSDPYQHPAS